MEVFVLMKKNGEEKTLSWHKKKLDIDFKKFIRMRDGRCLHCGSTENLQASHTVPVSHGNRFRYDERNVITLCYHCHLNWWHKNPIDAAQWYKKTFPENDAYLKAGMHERIKYIIPDLQEMRSNYKQKIKEYEKKIQS